MDYKFKKSTCERYDIRFGKFGGWAIITIDENGGLFNCLSDYDNYNYAWPNHGRKSFKHFIIEIARDSHYLLKKVAKKDSFDFDKNLKEWKKTLIKFRREESYCMKEYSKENIRQAWDFFLGLEDYSSNADMISYQIYESCEMRDLELDNPMDYFEVEKDYSPQAKAFADEIMAIFSEILKNEIAENEKGA